MKNKFNNLGFSLGRFVLVMLIIGIILLLSFLTYYRFFGKENGKENKIKLIGKVHQIDGLSKQLKVYDYANNDNNYSLKINNIKLDNDKMDVIVIVSTNKDQTINSKLYLNNKLVFNHDAITAIKTIELYNSSMLAITGTDGSHVGTDYLRIYNKAGKEILKLNNLYIDTDYPIIFKKDQIKYYRIDYQETSELLVSYKDGEFGYERLINTDVTHFRTE